ncbi:cysteine hydrolase family protein [Halobacteriovorax sp. RZ-1]|uniref:cysteine hydrolase family protein n=1 Tax=unclassified Halobacteriovorax TaxID=2639665 RepID=UPI00371E20FF
MKIIILTIGVLYMATQAKADFSKNIPKRLVEFTSKPKKPTITAKDKVALVIIDAQREYSIGKLKLWEMEKSIKASEKALNIARNYHIPIIHIQHKGSETSELFRIGTKEMDFIPRLAPVHNEKVIQKSLPNSFAKTDLHNYLTKLGIKKVIFIGYMTHMCLSSTIRAALDLGYQSFTFVQTTTTRDLRVKGEVIPAKTIRDSALAELADRFVTILELRKFEMTLKQK